MSPEFGTLDETAQQRVMAHTMMTKEIVEAAMIAAQQQAAMMQGAGGAPGEGGGRPKFAPPDNALRIPPQVALGAQLPRGGRGEGGAAVN